MKLWIYLGAWLYLAGILAAQCAAPSRSIAIQAAPDFQHLTRAMTWTGVPTNSSAIFVNASPSLGSGDSTNPIKVVVASSSATQTLGGLYSDINVSGSANDHLVEGGFFRGGNNGTGTVDIGKGSWSVGRNVGGGVITELRGAESNVLTFNSTTGTETAYPAEIYNNGTANVTLANGFRVQYLSGSGAMGALGAFTAYDWVTPSGTLGESYVLYADATTAPGAISHFIKSACPAPSILAGDVAFTNNARGPVLKDSVTGHFVRLTLANGVITQTDLGTGTP